MDPGLWRRIEPGTPPPWKRLAVMGRLVESGVRCSVFLAPILPGVTDSSESIEAVVRAAKEHGAAKVWSSPLRLAPLVKEHFYGFVADTFPDLIPRYDRAYPRADAPRAYQEGIKARVDRIRARYGFEEADRAAGGEAESGAANAPQPGFSQLTLTM
jgi:DNA repair photolyase